MLSLLALHVIIMQCCANAKCRGVIFVLWLLCHSTHIKRPKNYCKGLFCHLFFRFIGQPCEVLYVLITHLTAFVTDCMQGNNKRYLFTSQNVAGAGNATDKNSSISLIQMCYLLSARACGQ